MARVPVPYVSTKLLVTHIDLDGAGVLVLESMFHDVLGFGKVICRDYGFEGDPETVELMDRYDEIVFADISVPKESADGMRAKGKVVRFFDHHDSASWLSDDPMSLYDDKRCGTILFWDGYVKPLVRRYSMMLGKFMHLVDVYDRWVEDSPDWHDAVSLGFLMYSPMLHNWNTDDKYMAIKPFVDHWADRIRNMGSEWAFSDKEIAVITNSFSRLDEAYDDSIRHLDSRVDGKNRLFGVFSASSKISLVCSRILDNYPAYDYVVCVSSYKGVSGKLSLRTKRDDVDLTEIKCANGHKKACGGQVTSDDAVRFLNEHDRVLRYNDQCKEGDSEVFGIVDQDKASAIASGDSAVKDTGLLFDAPITDVSPDLGIE